MPARPGGIWIGILKFAEPVDGSTWTDAACTLGASPTVLKTQEALVQAEVELKLETAGAAKLLEEDLLSDGEFLEVSVVDKDLLLLTSALMSLWPSGKSAMQKHMIRNQFLSIQIPVRSEVNIPKWNMIKQSIKHG